MNKKLKKVLIISYHWPPSGNIAVLRCLKWTKYLREFGWEPIIYTAADAHYPNLDNSNHEDIPKGVQVIRRKIIEPYAFYKVLNNLPKNANVNNVFYVRPGKVGCMHHFSVWVRSNFFIPDARSWWIKPSVHFLLKYLDKNPVDAIISDGPPHTNTRIATELKKKLNIPWLADFQDPWTQADYFQKLSLTKWADQKHHRLEKEVFGLADKITIVSRHWKQKLEEIGAKNVSVIPWGYDPQDFEKSKHTQLPGFTITHLGTLGYDRNPQTFFRVLRKMGDQLKDFQAALKINLIGQIDVSVQKVIAEEGLLDATTIQDSVPRDQALEIMAQSPILLLLLNKQDNILGRVPGKLFEYLAVQRPILILGPPDSDAAEIIEKTGSGMIAAYDDTERIQKILIKFFEDFQSGVLKGNLNNHIEDFSVRNLTQQLATYLNDITNGS
ncbi:MAG: glycosyltransferase [Saprospiraceae bacterium]|nr:glycosyltransferase [Saprospiraceae bacterium]